jgi:hypothetical protein
MLVTYVNVLSCIAICGDLWYVPSKLLVHFRPGKYQHCRAESLYSLYWLHKSSLVWEIRGNL